MTERRTVSRQPVVVPALCSRGDGSEFHAVTVDISADGLRMRSAMPIAADERFTCRVRGVGAFEVRVAWTGTCDFAVRVIGTTPSPGEVARRFIEVARRQTQPSDGVRVHRRIVPTRTAVEVALADGRCVSARIVNLSVSGVALALDVLPDPGEMIVVGTRRALVARQIAGGIGAAFLEPLDDTAVGAHTRL